MLEKILNEGFVLLRQAKYGESMSRFNDALKHDPKNEKAYFGKAEVFRDMNDRVHALEMYDTSIKYKPDNLKAVAFKALILKSLNHQVEAQKEFAKAKAMKPDDAYDYAGLGFMHFIFGDVPTALSCYEDATKKDGKFAFAYLMQGNAFSATKQQSQAVEAYRNAIKSDDNFVIAHFNMANSLWSLREMKEAKVEYNKAIKINPQYALAHFNRGNFFFLGEKNFREAIKSYDDAIKVAPEFIEAYFQKGNVYLKQGKLEESLMCYDKAIEVRPDFMPAHLEKIQLLTKLGKTHEAETSHEMMIRSTKIMDKALYDAGNKFLYMGQVEAALECYNKALEYNKEFYPVVVAKAGILQEMGRSTEAIEYYQYGLKIQQTLYKDQPHPNTAGCLNNLGITYSAIGEKEKAIKYLVESLTTWEKLSGSKEYEQGAAICLLNLGNAYNANGLCDDAVECLEKSLKMFRAFYKDQVHHNMAQCLNNLGNTYGAVGRNGDAIVCYDEALKINPSFKDVSINKLRLLLKLEKGKEATSIYIPSSKSLVSDDDTRSIDSGFTENTNTSNEANNNGNVIPEWGNGILLDSEGTDKIRDLVSVAIVNAESDHVLAISEAKKLLSLVTGNQWSNEVIGVLAETITELLCNLVKYHAIYIPEIRQIVTPLLNSENDQLLITGSKVMREINKLTSEFIRKDGSTQTEKAEYPSDQLITTLKKGFETIKAKLLLRNYYDIPKAISEPNKIIWQLKAVPELRDLHDAKTQIHFEFCVVNGEEKVNLVFDLNTNKRSFSLQEFQEAMDVLPDCLPRTVDGFYILSITYDLLGIKDPIPENRNEFKLLLSKALRYLPKHIPLFLGNLVDNVKFGGVNKSLEQNAVFVIQTMYKMHEILRDASQESSIMQEFYSKLDTIIKLPIGYEFTSHVIELLREFGPLIDLCDIPGAESAPLSARIPEVICRLIDTDQVKDLSAVLTLLRIDSNHSFVEGKNLLLYATSIKARKSIDWMVEKGANPFKADQNGETAFSQALANHDTILAKKFITSSGKEGLLNDAIISGEDNVAFGLHILKGLYHGEHPLQGSLLGSNTLAIRECARAALDSISDDIQTSQLLAEVPELFTEQH